MRFRFLLVPLLLSLPGLPARADFSMQLQVKWEPVRYTLPQVATAHDAPAGGNRTLGDPTLPGNGGTSTLPSSSSVNAFQRQNLGALLGFGFTDWFTLQLGFDLARASLNHADSDANAINHAFTTLGLTVGFKFNLRKPARQKISPYVYADFFKYFTAINDDHPNNLSQSEVEFSAGLAAPLGFRIAFGVEYYFTESFALGAEIFGLQGAFSSGTLRRAEPGAPALVTHEQSLNTVSWYTALTLTFRFPRLIRYGRRYRYRDEEDRDRRYRRRRSYRRD